MFGLRGEAAGGLETGGLMGTLAMWVGIIGCIVFILGDRIHPDIKEIGRIFFFCGTLAWLFGH